MNAHDPLDIYKQLIQKHQASLDLHLKKRKLLGWTRFIVFIIIIFICYQVFVHAGFWGIVPLVTGIGVLLFLVSLDVNNNQKIANTRTLIRLNEEETEVMAHRFHHREDGAQYNPALHDYANDLDLFGKASLFQWSNRCFTEQGKNLLAKNLLEGISTADIHERHEAIKEIAPLVEWRQQLQALSMQNPVTSATENRTATWLGEEDKHFKSRSWKIIVWVYTVITISLATAAILGFIPGGIFSFFYGIFLVSSIILSRNTIKPYILLSGIVKEIGTLQQLVAWIEQRKFNSLRLKNLQRESQSYAALASDENSKVKGDGFGAPAKAQAGSNENKRLEGDGLGAQAIAHSGPDENKKFKGDGLGAQAIAHSGPDENKKFKGEGLGASNEIKELKSILDRFDLRLNIAGLLFFNAFLLWDVRQMIALNQWRAKNRLLVSKWFQMIAEMEVLNSMAIIHFNHSKWAFPQLSPDHFIFRGKQLGHPLISEVSRVTSDFDLEGTAKIALVTGSNMAGKSTFLRSLGVNTVLAQMGAPVCAEQLILSPVRLMSSMRIADNLAENTSTFYAELKKLKTIIEAVNRHEKIFILLDEILRGTNSLDRHTGSAALMEQLIRQKAVAVIATHDLELASLSNQYTASLDNYHFDVQVAGEELYFDYKLKHGVCTSLNASILMKKIGIELN